jgi:tetratricopeptide (TPR) repeat protein
MARKRSQPRKRPPGDRRPDKSDSQPLPKLRDRRANEAVLSQLTGMHSARPAADDVLSRAQDLMYRAFDIDDADGRITLARQALEISPDCADAYVVLAETARTAAEALEYYAKGVAAGERALGPRTFDEDIGHFWGLVHTRPYMRARMGLAHLLADMGRPEEAIRHSQDMLRLNPGDNQGVRHGLLSQLIQHDRHDEAGELIAQYDDATALWAYNQALLAFRRERDTAESRRLLKSAYARNRFVPSFMLGEEPLPGEAPDMYSIGSREEAVLYTGDSLSIWRSTPGALTWFNEVVAKRPMASKDGEKPIGPSPRAKQDLRRLPQSDIVVQAGLRRLPKWLMDDGEKRLPWVVLMVDPTTELILGTELFIEEPTTNLLWDKFLSALELPAAADASRPSRIVVEPNSLWHSLVPHLEEIGIEFESSGELPFLQSVFEDLVEKMTHAEPPGLLDVPRVKPGAVAGLFDAAAEFYRKAPWRFVGDSHALKIECARFESGPWYAVIMGQSGITLGLALYEKLEMIHSLWEGDAGDRQRMRRSVVLSVTLDDESDANAKDLVAATEHGWVVAHPEAFPTVSRKERGMTMRPPLAWELALLEGCLRAIPEFVADHRPGDTSRVAMTTPVASGELEIALSWVV